MNLAVYRAYDPDLGRWLSRDPIAESGGINLYRYSSNNSANLTDLAGLDPQSQARAIIIGGAIGFVLSLPVDALEDFFSGGVLIIANPATTAAMTGVGSAAGAWVDNIFHSAAQSDGSGNGQPLRGRDARRLASLKLSLNTDQYFCCS